MGRTILAVIFGTIAMAICVGAIEALGHGLYPPPPGIDLNDPEALKTLIAQMPMMALVFVVLAWAVGSLVGGFVAAKVSHLHKQGAAIAIGVIMILLAGISLVMIPHPIWMIACAVVLPIPLALLGRKLAG